jgi:hypothetical protein
MLWKRGIPQRLLCSADNSTPIVLLKEGMIQVEAPPSELRL